MDAASVRPTPAEELAMGIALEEAAAAYQQFDKQTMGKGMIVPA